MEEEIKLAISPVNPPANEPDSCTDDAVDEIRLNLPDTQKAPEIREEPPADEPDSCTDDAVDEIRLILPNAQKAPEIREEPPANEPDSCTDDAVDEIRLILPDTQKAPEIQEKEPEPAAEKPELELQPVFRDTADTASGAANSEFAPVPTALTEEKIDTAAEPKKEKVFRALLVDDVETVSDESRSMTWLWILLAVLLLSGAGAYMWFKHQPLIHSTAEKLDDLLDTNGKITRMLPAEE